MSRYVCAAPSTAISCAAGNGLEACSAAKTRGDTRPRRHRATHKMLRRLQYIALSPLLISTVLRVLMVEDYLSSDFTLRLYHRFSDKCANIGWKFDAIRAEVVW